MIRTLLSLTAGSSAAEAALFGMAKAIGGTKRKHSTSPTVKREIDAVYLWVNDQDPAWQSKRAKFQPKSEVTVASSKSRFRQFDELLVSIQLLAANAPFIRKVFVVVDDQQPKLDSIKFDLPFEVELVNHTDFIPKEFLPTFNSRAITAHLHKIAGLSERFLYLNDDVFIGRPSLEKNWFDGERLQLRFTETRFPAQSSLATNEVLYQARWKTKSLADAKGWNVSDRMPEHAPYPLTKSIMAAIWKLFPDDLKAASASRFRSHDSVLPELLAFYYAIGNDLASTPKNSNYKYVPMNEKVGILPLIDLALKPNHFLTICLNDVSEVSPNARMSERNLLRRYQRALGYLLSTVAKRR